MSSRLVVSIINYRMPELTLACVRSMLAAADGIALSVVVIDNASGDGSDATIRDWIEGQDPPVPVTLMASEINLGFAGGHNAVMHGHPAAFYLLLNSDTLVRDGALTRLLAAARARPRAGLLAPALEDEDGARQISCFRLHSPASELIRGAALSFTGDRPGKGDIASAMAGMILPIRGFRPRYPKPTPDQILGLHQPALMHNAGLLSLR